LYTENKKEYGKGKLKYQEQKNKAWIGGAMDIQEEQGNIVVSSNTLHILNIKFLGNCMLT
jgi:hypothetical protein